MGCEKKKEKTAFLCRARRMFLVMLLSLIIAAASLAAGWSGIRAEARPDDSILTENLKFANRNYTDVQTIQVPYVNVNGNTTVYCDAPYSDEFFQYESGEFDTELARSSFGLAVSAFRNDGKNLPNQYETFLTAAGFSDIYAFGYDEPTTIESLSGVMAWKKIGDFILIAAVPCGQNYKKEWGSNLKVGDGDRHQGFDEAAKKFEAQIRQYIADKNIEGKAKLWLSGFSRASAVSNLTAADFIESGEFEEVYAYLFGVPRTTRTDPWPYRGIYNICGSFDPVPVFPMSTWGFARYGIDLFLPSQEEDSDYRSQVEYMNEVYSEVTGKNYHNIPLINYRMFLMIEFLAEMFPESKDYAETLQGLLISQIADPANKNIMEILTAVFTRLGEMDKSQEEAASIFLDYLQMIASEHLKGVSVFTEDTGWDPDSSIPMNYMREHLPAVYQSWVYSDLDPEYLYQGFTITRRFVLLADMGVMVTDSSDRELVRVDKNGKLHRDALEDGEDVPDIFVLRTGKETIVTLPVDREYSVQLSADKHRGMVYFQVITTSSMLTGFSDIMYTGSADAGIYKMTLQPNYLSLSPFKVIEGRLYNLKERDMEYSPSLLMAAETENTKHLTLGHILFGTMVIVSGLLLLGLICLIIWIAHLVRRKKRSRPYSNLYVIIPHLLLVLLFAFLVQFASVNLVSVGIAKNIISALMVFCIFLLALRGTLRCLTADKKGGYRKQSKRKKLFAIVFTFLMLGMTAVCYFFFSRSLFSGYRMENNILCGAAVILFCVISILIFPTRLPKKDPDSNNVENTEDDMEGKEILL